MKEIDQICSSPVYYSSCRGLEGSKCKSKHLQTNVQCCSYSHSLAIKSHFPVALNKVIDWLFTACRTLYCPRSISALHTSHCVCIIDFLPAILLPGHWVTFNDLSTWQCHIHHSLSIMTDLNSNANMKWRLTSIQILIHFWIDTYQHNLMSYMEDKITSFLYNK